MKKSFHLKSLPVFFLLVIFIFETLLNNDKAFSNSSATTFSVPKIRPWRANSNTYQVAGNSSSAVFLKAVLHAETTGLPFTERSNDSMMSPERKGYRERDLDGNRKNVTHERKSFNVTKPLVFEENSTTCNNIHLMPKGTMPYIVLWSLPGSGNTWLRYLIEHVTGIFTGSVGNDTSLFDGGFKGQLIPAKSGRTVAVKTHNLIDARDADGILFLIRNPYESAIAEINRRVGKGHTSYATEEIFMRPQWRTFAIDHVKKWVLNIKNCVVLPQKKLIVYYEDLQSDLRNQLKRIVNFLGLSVDEQRLQCTLQHREGNFHRPKRKLSFDPFKKPVRLVFNKSIREVIQVMSKYHVPVMRSYERQ